MSQGEFPEILGVYSLEKESQVGTGTTVSTKHMLTYWYARKLAPQVYEVQPLNMHHVPSGIRKELGELDFLRYYVPEPGYYQMHTVPALQSLYRKLGQGEEALAALQLDQAERHFIKALMIDELNVPANMGLGEVYSERKDVQKLRRVLSVLIGIDDAFRAEHCVRFNKFGISLRKNGHYEESLRFYERALQVREDEHLHFNIARVYYEQGNTDKCVSHLQQAITINPLFREAHKFIAHCAR